MKSLGKDLIRLNFGGGLGESPKRPSQTWNLSSVGRAGDFTENRSLYWKQ